MIIGLIYFVLTLGIIVLVHEAGHLLVAKKYGVFCHEFSIGMGPKIWKVGTDKSGTIYNIRAIPLGGYVILAGEETGNPADENISEKQKFDNKSKWIKFQVLVAGAVMNFILAIILLFFVSFFGGSSNLNSNQINVISNTPLSEIGVKTGSEILEINGEKTSNYTDILNTLKKDIDNEIQITYQNSGEEKKTTTVKKSSEDDLYGFSAYTEKYKLFNSISNSAKNFYTLIMSNFISINMLFTNQASVSDLSGPIGIADYSIKVAQTNFIYILSWVALLSVGIGFINLMPIPALDGGRILFLLIEFIIRKPINKKLENRINTIVFVSLLVLFVYISFNDVVKIVGG